MLPQDAFARAFGPLKVCRAYVTLVSDLSFPVKAPLSDAENERGAFALSSSVA